MSPEAIEAVASVVAGGSLMWIARKQIVAHKGALALAGLAVLVEIYAEFMLAPGTPIRIVFFWIFAVLMALAIVPVFVRFVRRRPRPSRE